MQVDDAEDVLAFVLPLVIAFVPKILAIFVTLVLASFLGVGATS